MNSTAQRQLPADIRERVFDVLTQAHAPQWIETDLQLRVRRSLGSPLLRETHPGAFLADVLPCLVGAQEIAPITFPVVNLDASHIVDVHLFPANEGFEVLLIDASAQHAEARENQQQAHEIALLNRRLEKLTVALDLARSDAESASEAKSRFIAGMSHEFRTPLTSVMGFTELMGSGVASREEGLTGIRESAMYLLSLVDNLLEHGSAGKGPVAVNRERVLPEQYFKGLVSQLRPLADKKGLTLLLTGPTQPEVEFIIDPIRCRQILNNLLTNALRHTNTGGVELNWRRVQQNLVVDVIDTGSGIAPHDLERIFRPFERGEGAEGRPGAGLGLAISQQLSVAMGGTLAVDSTLGAGSTFTLTLPLETADRVVAEQSAAVARRPTMSVLVVDDDPNICAVLRLALTDAGHEVSICRSQAEALSHMDEGIAPNVALVDLDLYGSDGLEVVAELKHRSPEMSIFAMSAASSSRVMERVRSAGCLGFISKPFELGELARLIEQAAVSQVRQ